MISITHLCKKWKIFYIIRTYLWDAINDWVLSTFLKQMSQYCLEINLCKVHKWIFTLYIAIKTGFEGPTFSGSIKTKLIIHIMFLGIHVKYGISVNVAMGLFSYLWSPKWLERPKARAGGQARIQGRSRGKRGGWIVQGFDLHL